MSKELRLDGPVVVEQCDTDPGDMGEPRVFESEGVTYVCVPSFNLWPKDGNGVEAALQQAAARVSAALFALVSDEVFDAVQRAVLDDPAVAAPLRTKRREPEGRPEHPDNEHMWQWGTDHGDGTYSHGPCVVKGCGELGQSHVPYHKDVPS